MVLKHSFAADRRDLIIELAALSVLVAAVVASTLDWQRNITLAALSFALFALIFAADYDLRRGSKLRRLLAPDTDPAIARYPRNSTERALFEAMVEWAESGFIVFGEFVPFVGAGVPLDSWSLAINLSRPKVSGSILPFDLPTLRARIASDVLDTRIPDLQAATVVFVHGHDVRPHELGRARIRPSDLDGVPLGHSGREYTCFRTTDADGDLSLSCFLRTTLLGSAQLVLEVNQLLLPPLDDAYRVCENGPASVLDIAAHSVLGVLTAGFVFPLRIISRSVTFLGRASERQSTTKDLASPAHNFGARRTAREMAAQDSFRRYFQRMDKELFKQVVEKQILETVGAFLDDHNIDTSEFRQRQALILNSGVMITGGSLQAGTLAVGKAAKASGVTSWVRQKLTGEQHAEESE